MTTDQLRSRWIRDEFADSWAKFELMHHKANAVPAPFP
jgi:hypothetical protein